MTIELIVLAGRDEASLPSKMRASRCELVGPPQRSSSWEQATVNKSHSFAHASTILLCIPPSYHRSAASCHRSKWVMYVQECEESAGRQANANTNRSPTVSSSEHSRECTVGAGLMTNSVLFRRNYVFLSTVFVGAFAFEMYESRTPHSTAQALTVIKGV